MSKSSDKKKVNKPQPHANIKKPKRKPLRRRLMLVLNQGAMQKELLAAM